MPFYPFTCLRTRRTESCLLVSSSQKDEEKPPFRVPPYWTDGVPHACFLVPNGRGQALPFRTTSLQTDEVPFVLVPCRAGKDHLFSLFGLATLTAWSTTVKMSTRAGSQNCSDDTCHTVYLFSDAKSISLALGIPLSIPGASFFSCLGVVLFFH